jgi:hypothetical protein
MTAPGSAWVGSHHLPDGLDFASAHMALFDQAPRTSYVPHYSHILIDSLRFLFFFLTSLFASAKWPICFDTFQDNLC